MEHENEDTLVLVDPELPAPRILQAVNNEIHTNIFDDCTIVTRLPSFAEAGYEIRFVFDSPQGPLFGPRERITPEQIDRGEAEWHITSFKLSLKPGMQISVEYTIYKGDHPIRSPRVPYQVVR
ncbi:MULTISPECIES: hypothetical protein [Pseudomonas]|uniref:hypothetical protein n=1 Tax=Pseudomonas TaxID=286 RepID=UPI000A514AAE|nr:MULTISPECIES: hypothetical protein [Pseudomonas]